MRARSVRDRVTMTLRFGTDGVRGVANSELTVELVTALGRAAVRVIGAEQPYVVGRDTRRSGPMLEAALVAGICAEGADVVLAGVLPTPGVAHLAHERAAAAAVISASHNPYEDNGIKLFAAGRPQDHRPARGTRRERAHGAGGVDARGRARRDWRRDRVRVPRRARRLRRAPRRVARGSSDRRHARRRRLWKRCCVPGRALGAARRSAPRSRCCTRRPTARTSTTAAVPRTRRSSRPR